MISKEKRLFFFGKAAKGILIALLVPLAVSAQSTTSAATDSSASAEIQFPADVVNCFDYYHFGSVQAHLTSPVTGTVTGTPITFSGTLENSNPYPIVDGAFYVKIFRSRDDNDSNGPDVVDQFLVKGDIVIPGNGSVPVSFTWDVPAHARAGDYKMATFFTTSRKFNLLGLSFTDDVIGNSVPFSVTSETAEQVYFDKSGVNVNDQPYHFASYLPREDEKAPITVRARIVNSSKVDEKATLHWQVNQWDAQLPENVLQVESSEVTVPAHGSKDVSITVKDAKYPVYLVVGTLAWKDTKSVIGVRFMRNTIDRPRINFPGILKYPLVAGEPNTLFSCIHNTGTSNVIEGSKLDIVLSDLNGKEIHSYTYSGPVSGAMMGVADHFSLEKTYDSFKLDARLYRNDVTIDEAHLVYDCSKLKNGECEAFRKPQPVASFTDFLKQYLGSGGFLIAALIVLVLLAAIFSMLRKSNGSNSTI